MPQNLSGNSAFHYTGVNARTPPNFYLRNRAPTILDWQEYTIGDEWMDNLSSSATYRSVWKNVGVQPSNAIWVLMTTGGGDLVALTSDGAGVALPDASGQIKIAGDRDITTNVNTANQVQVALNNEILLGDLSVNPPGTNSLEVVTGDIQVTLGDINVASGNVTVVGDGTTTGQIVAIGQANSAVATGIFIAKDRAGGVITSGDELGSLNFTGFDGTANITASRIIATNSGTVAATRIASNLRFFTHPDSVTASTERMVIAPTGEVTINAPDSGVGLQVNGGAANIVGLYGRVVGGTNLPLIVDNTGQIGTSPATTSASVLASSNVSLNLSSAGSIIYIPPFGGPSTNQAQSEFVMPTAGTIDNLYVQVFSNTSTTDGQITLNLNGVNTALTVTIPFGATGIFSNLVDSVIVAEGDTIQFESAQTTIGTLTGNPAVRLLT